MSSLITFVEWAIEYGDEIGLAQIELGGGLER
jgi:hypothetical protein